MPFDSVDNSTSPSVLLHPSPPMLLVTSCLALTPWTITTATAAPLICFLLSSEAIVPHVVTYFEEVASISSLSTVDCRLRCVHTKQTWNSNTPILCADWILLSLSSFNFLLMVLVDNCHKLPSWFHFPLSSPKFLALAPDKGMSTSKGFAKSLTPSREERRTIL